MSSEQNNQGNNQEQGSQRWALVRNGKIINVIVWDGSGNWTPPPDCSVMLEAEALGQGLEQEPAE